MPAGILLLAAAALAACAPAPVSPNDPGLMGADDSASIQNAVDEAARRGTGRVVVPARNARTGADGWTITRAILLPSNMAVELRGARLTMADGVYENFFRTANVWTDAGRLPGGAVTNVSIVGRDGAVLDGAKPNGLDESTSLKGGRPHVRANCPVLFVNVADFAVSGLTIENHRYWGMCFCFCRRGRIAGIRFVARFDRRNQDGINLRLGCRDIEIADISGQTGDDMIALSAIDTGPAAGRPASRWSCWVEGLPVDIRNVAIRNVRGAAVGHPLVALRNSNGAKILDVLIENVEDTWFDVPCAEMARRRYAMVRLGDHVYWSSRRAAPGELARVTARGLRSSYSEDCVYLHNTLADSTISGVRCTGRCASAVTLGSPEWGVCGASIDNVTIEDAVVAPDRPDAAVFACAYLNPGDVISGLRLRACEVRTPHGTIRYADEAISRRGGDPAPLAAHEGVRELSGAVTLDGGERGFIESAPFRARADRPELRVGVQYRRTELAKAEVSTAADADGAPGAWSPFAEVENGGTVSVQAGEWLRYRITLRRGAGRPPRLTWVKVGDLFHSRWRLDRQSDRPQ